MSIKEVTMYRVVCNHNGCDASPQDDTEFFAWMDADCALDQAMDADWFHHEGQHLCPEHAPICAYDECARQLHDREFGDFCDDHEDEPTSVRLVSVTEAVNE